MSILECIQEELSSPTSELVNNHVALVHELVDQLFEDFKEEQNAKVEEIKKCIHVTLDDLKIGS